MLLRYNKSKTICKEWSRWWFGLQCSTTCVEVLRIVWWARAQFSILRRNSKFRSWTWSCIAVGSDVESVRPPRWLATDILVTSRQLTWLELIASLLNTNTNTNADANTYNSDTPPQSLHLLRCLHFARGIFRWDSSCSGRYCHQLWYRNSSNTWLELFFSDFWDQKYTSKMGVKKQTPKTKFASKGWLPVAKMKYNYKFLKKGPLENTAKTFVAFRNCSIKNSRLHLVQ